MTVLPPPLNASRWRMGGDHDRWQDTDRLSVAESMGRKLTAFNIQAEGFLSNRGGRLACGGGSGRRPAWPLRREMAAYFMA